jgi:hypothetical protein
VEIEEGFEIRRHIKNIQNKLDLGLFSIATGCTAVRLYGRVSTVGRAALSHTEYTLVLGPIQPPIQWVPGLCSPGVKRPGRDANHSRQSIALVKLYLNSPIHIRDNGT